MFSNQRSSIIREEEYMFRESWESRNIPRETGGVAMNRTKRISWGAIIGGVVVALVVQMVLSLLGLGIGFGTINPVEETNSLSGLGTGTLIWWVVSMLISLFAGGYVAGRLAGFSIRTDSILHGILTWAVFTLVSFYLLTTAVGGILNTAGNIVGKVTSAAGQGMSAIAPQAKEQIQQVLQQSGLTAEELRDPEIARAFDNMFTSGGRVIEENKGQLVNLVAEKTNKSQAEADQMVTQWIESYESARTQVSQITADAKQKAEQTAADISSTASKVGIFGAIGLILGAIVTALGSLVGKPKNEVLVPEREVVYKK